MSNLIIQFWSQYQYKNKLKNKYHLNNLLKYDLILLPIIENLLCPLFKKNDFLYL
jgi:hypothetical protein